MSRQIDAADELHQTVTSAVLKYAERQMGKGRHFDLLALDAWAIIARDVEQSRRFWIIQARSPRPGERAPSWAAIAATLGMTKQAAQQRYQAVIDLARRDAVHGWAHWLRYEVGCCAACHRPMHHENASKPWKGQRKRQVQLTTGATVAVCESCAADPGKLLTIETEPLV